MADTGLPMGESDTILGPDGALWSYVHASDRSAGVVDGWGAPVPFPGCVVRYVSQDGGVSFTLPEPVCLFTCAQKPCDIQTDHIDQQQYPRVVREGDGYLLAYEHRAMVFLARSTDGVNWTRLGQLPGTGVWRYDFRGCAKAESVGVHPFSPYEEQCLVGGPPGLFVDGGEVYVFVGLGRNPGGMGCYKAPVGAPVEAFTKCLHNPLFTGAEDYGPVDLAGPDANPYFDFRTISSAEVQRIGARYYMLYEGVRGPGPGDPGDTQFGLGLARSTTEQVDGPWETFPGNPILVDLPGNIGLGHGDLVLLNGRTYLYTSLDGETRSRLALVW
ncbi:MAG: hypothetical protein D6790_21890, partial [Caldilineae bacterium]